jgi:alkanesulfonate monooxygenase SsuD/methylene tetrahydromethanopterin reductase-like flavin-dependent oxidoreductase (luciferase family)
MWLLAAAAGSREIEVGMSVLQVPLRYPVELAQRLMTLHALSGGRFIAGLGAGSTKADFDAVGVDYDSRFRQLDEALKTIRALCRGEKVGAADLKPWPDTVGGPPIMIGAWTSGIWIRRAARQYDGWLASGGGPGATTFKDLKDGIKLFRDLGGKRAMVATVRLDLTAPTEPLTDEARFSLTCEPAVARERMQILDDLGYDDVLVGGEHLSDEELFVTADQLGLKRRAPA